MLSDPETRHSRELEANNRVAATVAPNYSDFALIKGLQIAGTACRIVMSDKDGQYRALLEARYSFLRGAAAGTAQLCQAYKQSAVYRLEPRCMALIDNAKGFGHKDTVYFSA